MVPKHLKRNLGKSDSNEWVYQYSTAGQASVKNPNSYCIDDANFVNWLGFGGCTPIVAAAGHREGGPVIVMWPRPNCNSHTHTALLDLCPLYSVHVYLIDLVLVSANHLRELWKESPALLGRYF